jgi:hypothetical protein
MVIIGILLIAAAGAFGVDLAVKNRFHIGEVEAFGSGLGVHTASQVFIVGAIAGAVLFAGFALLIAGLGRKGVHARSRRRERREAAAVSQQAAELQTENQRLREAQVGPAPVAPPARDDDLTTVHQQSDPEQRPVEGRTARA